mmetsp:Transcript_11994/g.34363  ORF Transcript_11994/g.34363 Transcript_11994/m.34363 type:complete len:362 (-) Transcript_11994:219-1304(-)
MMSINSILLASMLLVGSPAVLAQDNSTCSTITDIICDEPNLNAVCEAISMSELDDDLNEDTWTVFVPTDDAFEALGRDNLDFMVLGNDTVPLTDLLLYHVVPGVSLTSDLLPCQAGLNLIEMANGEDTRTKCTAKIPTAQKGVLNSKDDPPNIVESDIIACNGVVHILDKVMLYEELPYPIPEPDTDEPEEEVVIVAAGESSPEEEVVDEPTVDEPTVEEPTEEPDCLTISELACSNPLFSILCTLLTDNGLVDDLSDGLWTVFAPNNFAFDNAPPFPADTDINFVLQGHVVANEALLSEDLPCTGKVEMLNGKNTRTVCRNGVKFQNGGGNDDTDRPEIITSDIEVCNGIVHVVDKIILT